jgi:hypothetical protein
MNYDLADLREYMRCLPDEKLAELVMDMFWKDQTVRQSELFRFMLLLREKGAALPQVKLTRRPRFLGSKPAKCPANNVRQTWGG